MAEELPPSKGGRRVDLVSNRVGRIEDFQNPGIEAAFVRTWRHLHGFASRHAQLVGEGWAAEGKASAGDLEFFNTAGTRIAVTIEPGDPRLPPQRILEVALGAE